MLGCQIPAPGLEASRMTKMLRKALVFKQKHEIQARRGPLPGCQIPAPGLEASRMTKMLRKALVLKAKS